MLSLFFSAGIFYSFYLTGRPIPHLRMWKQVRAFVSGNR